MELNWFYKVDEIVIDLYSFVLETRTKRKNWNPKNKDDLTYIKMIRKDQIIYLKYN